MFFNCTIIRIKKYARAKKEGYVSIASLCLNAGKTFNAVRNDLVTGATISDHLTSHHRTYQNDDLCASCDQFTSPFRQFGVLLIHLLDRYKLETEETEGDKLLELVGRKRGMLLSGGVPNTERAAITLLDEFRGTKLGRISLEKPEKG